jgi:hypothetical protein
MTPIERAKRLLHPTTASAILLMASGTPLPEGGRSMSNFRGKSFAFVASAVGAALMSGPVSAQTAAPIPAPAANAPPAMAPVAKPQKKPHKKVTRSVVVVVTNSRTVALTKLDATPSGGILPKAIVSNLAPGKKISVTVATDKTCVFNLHGAYADGSSTDSASVDLCKDKNVNLVE